MRVFRASLKAAASGLTTHRRLLWDMAQRDATSRYKGSYLGVVWAFITPLLMLGIYSFVFGHVFKAKWTNSATGGTAEFILIIFCGLMVFNVFAECIARAPSMILVNPNYVKKIIFPLEILPLVNMASALMHFGISLVLLLAAQLLLFGKFPVLIFLLPIVLAPFILFTLALSWFLAALGVYVRDIGQIVNVVVTALMFTAPLFFPLSAIGPDLQWLLKFNPVSLPIDAARDVLIFDRMPDIAGLAVYSAICVVIFALCFTWFQHARRGFADVI